MILRQTKEILRKNKINLKKSLGQNLLIDDAVVRRIADEADIKDTDLIIEIGPGTGTLTIELAKRAKWVVAIEIDKQLIPALTENLKRHTIESGNTNIVNIDIINMDAMEAKLDDMIALLKEVHNPESVKVVANLPYYITTPLIMKLLEDSVMIDSMVIMVQKEVAGRMAGKPGTKEYGALSVAVQYYSRPEILFTVPPHSFLPQPEVDSAVIKLSINKTPLFYVTDPGLLFKTVKAAFGQRRKTLVNALVHSFNFRGGKEEIRCTLRNLGIDENCRGETLSLQQFSDLTNTLYERGIGRY